MPERLPLFASGSSYKGPFIHDQALRWLKAPEDRRFDCLDLGLFRAGRNEVEETEEQPQGQLPSGCQWIDLAGFQERLDFLCDASRTRTCLLIEAGIGKTTAMQQIAYLHNRSKGHLAIGLPFSNLPHEAEDMLDREGDSFLVRLFCETQETRGAPKPAIARMIQRKIRAGQFTLVVDALDQTSGVHDVPKLARALHGFLLRYPQGRCVVSGRPTSVLQRRHDLFEGGDWCYVQLMEFTPQQQEFYVGSKRWEQMQRLEADLLAQPRTGEEVRKLSPAELAEIRTAAELHYQVLQKTLRSATKEQDVDIGIHEAEMLLALIAYGMHEEDNFDGVDTDDFRPFVGRVFHNHKDVSALANFYSDANALIKRIQELGKLNAVLEFAFLEQTQETQLYFRNRTIQDFLAARWLSCYSCKAREQNWLRAHLHLWGGFNEHFQEAQRYQFWRFLTEMPVQAMDKKRMHWLAAIQTLYVPTSTSDEPQRSTEMIYRSWWNLLDLAGKFPATSQHAESGRLVEQDLWDALTEFQMGVRIAYEKEDLCYDPCPKKSTDAKQSATQLLNVYFTEMFALCDGTHPRCVEANKELADFDQHGFKVIPSGEYWIGEGEEEANILTLDDAFEMARFPLTNSIMDTFDPNRPQRFRRYASYSSAPKCPSIYANWYDAICVAMWLHARLPNEYEWERACRGKQTPPLPNHRWYSGPNEQDLDKVAWYRANAKSKTHPVGEANETKLPNDFELYHMHGSVWEWTLTWYANVHQVSADSTYTGSSRVLRGGSFDFGPNYCRSAYRDDRQPSFCFFNSGVRLARARKS